MTTKSIIRIITDIAVLSFFIYWFTKTPVIDIKTLLLYTAVITAEIVSIDREFRRN